MKEIVTAIKPWEDTIESIENFGIDPIDLNPDYDGVPDDEEYYSSDEPGAAETESESLWKIFQLEDLDWIRKATAELKFRHHKAFPKQNDILDISGSVSQEVGPLEDVIIISKPPNFSLLRARKDQWTHQEVPRARRES